MILATFVATVCMAVPSIVDDPLKCAVMGTPTNAKSKAIEYAGARFPMCCGGCPSAFTKDPGKYIKAAGESDTTIAQFMFDPVGGSKLDLAKVKDTVDYKGVRYGFTSADDMTAFKADPAKYTAIPEKESLTCPNSGEKIDFYSKAGGFVDYDGVRYYTCCGDCLAAMKKDPAGVIAKGKAKLAKPMAMPAPVEKPGN